MANDEPSQTSIEPRTPAAMLRFTIQLLALLALIPFAFIGAEDVSEPSAVAVQIVTDGVLPDRSQDATTSSSCKCISGQPSDESAEVDVSGSSKNGGVARCIPQAELDAFESLKRKKLQREAKKSIDNTSASKSVSENSKSSDQRIAVPAEEQLEKAERKSEAAKEDEVSPSPGYTNLLT